MTVTQMSTRRKMMVLTTERYWREFGGDFMSIGQKMELLTFIRTADLTKVRIGERQRGEDEPKLLDTTIGRVVPLLPVAPAHGESELEDSVYRLFKEEGKDGQAKQGDSASGGQEKQKSMIVDSDEPSHPAKKLRKDYEIPVGTSVAGKSMPAIQRLLAGAVQNVAVRGEPISSLPFVTSSVSTTSEREDKRHTDTLAGTEADSLIRSSAPAMTTATTVTVTASAATVVKETVAKPSLFATGSSSVGGTESIPVGFSDLSGNDFLVGDIRTVIDPDSDLQKVYVLRWNVTNGSPSKFETAKKSLQDEIRSLKERNAALEKEKGKLDVRVVDLSASVKVREQEAAALDVVVTTVHGENILMHELQEKSRCMRTGGWGNQLEKFQDERMKEVNDKFDKLDVDVIEMALHTVGSFIPHMLTHLVGARGRGSITAQIGVRALPLARGGVLSVAMRVRSDGALRGRKGHGAEGGVGVHLGGMLLCVGRDEAESGLEPVAERLGLQESQPHEDQLMVPIHHSPDQTVVGAASLSFSLDVSRTRIIKKSRYYSNHRSALRDVFVSIVEPLSSVALEGTKSISSTVPETTTALSVTFAPVSSIPPIFMDDYEIAHADDQGNAGADVDPFPNVDDAELIIS
ncbi:hypothetical protein Tco_1145118 [Tanacetum coccineum]